MMTVPELLEISPSTAQSTCGAGGARNIRSPLSARFGRPARRH
jgi:hypothetical protein